MKEYYYSINCYKIIGNFLQKLLEKTMRTQMNKIRITEETLVLKSFLKLCKRVSQ